MKHQEIWKKNTSDISVSSIVNNYHHPNEFQKELAQLINKICNSNGYRKVIEVGCESGITTMLLDQNLEKYFLDLNESILDKVKQACAELGIEGEFLSEDMFSMQCPAESYDVVFNSGVIEHFNEKERIDILKEYSRVLKPDGLMVLAVPNHYSFPYRSAYLLKKKLLRGFQWPWPEEFKIYDLEIELKATNLELLDRVILSKDAIFNFWSFIKPVKKLLLWSDSVFDYEGYLTTLVIKKQS